MRILKSGVYLDMNKKKFQEIIWNYYRENRRDLPWRRTSNPYRILVSEVMLQQTQVSRVIVKYKEFLKRFPTVQKLAQGSVSDVLHAWQGLGYNRRGLYLHNAAIQIVEKWKGQFPQDQKLLSTLPGVGVNTAGAICAYAFNMPTVFIETNIRKVYIHHFFKDVEKVSDRSILELVDKTLDISNPREWYWGLMDYGTYLSKNVLNPNRQSKHYIRQSKFEGSNRQLRGRLLRYLLQRKSVTLDEITKEVNLAAELIKAVTDGLEKDGFIVVSKNKVSIKK